jgi:hypothetical protein
MSIMTIRKRIALVAVTALTAGLFTVVSVPVANAAVVADDFDITSTDLLAICSVSTDKETAYVPSTSPGVVITTSGATTNETAYVRVSGPGVISTFTAGTGGTAPAPVALSPTAIYFGDLSDDELVEVP